MASFSDVVKRQRKEGSSRTGALASAVGQKTLESIDPRKFFDQSGVLTTLFPSLKAYKAKGVGDKDSGDKSLNKLATLQASGDAATRVTLEEMVIKLDNNLVFARLTAKNSTVLPQMARDMNLTKQNIGRLLNLFGGTQATRTSDYFKRAAERESAVEAAQARQAARKTEPTKVETKKDELGFLSSLFAPLMAAIAPLIASMKSFGTELANVFGISKFLTGEMGLLRAAVTALLSPIGLVVAALGALAWWLGKQGGEAPTSEDVSQGNVPGGWSPEQGSRASPNIDDLGQIIPGGKPMGLPQAMKETQAESALKGAAESDDSYSKIEQMRANRPVDGASISPVKEGFDFEKYKEQVGFFEGRGNYGADNKLGFLGKYQFGAQALETFGYLKPGTSKDKNAVYNPENWTGKDGIGNADAFKANAALQDKLFTDFTMANLKALVTKKVIDASMSGEEVAARLYAAHHGGVGGATKFFKEGKDTKDFAYANASVGKSAEKMKVSFAGGKTSTSGPQLASASMSALEGRMSLAMAPTNPPTIIQDNSTKVQNSGSGQSQQISAWDNFMIENILKMKA